ncbi:phage tail protein [Shewanella algae]|uniref:phage tail-collar fiber domain-containing protein n=1 Tax=Shewanella algae TaxID=38313 RepID=UPI0031F485D7
MGSVITIAGEKLFAAKAQANQQLDIDTFIFANVPGQDPTAPIDREEPLPPQAQIVHQQVVQQVGRINENVVVYSTVLDSVTGPFEFNWVGLYSSVNQTLVAINHVPTVAKTVTGPGVAGNTLNRNFGIEYSGIADLTGITVAPETWQLDFTARLSGMDELTRQLAADMNGKDWFIGDGFKVVPRATANSFSVTPGVGYVSGLRIELEQEHIINVQTYPQFVYVDAWFAGDANSMWKPQVAFTVSDTEMDDYIDVQGVQHYVYKLAVVNAVDYVADLRLTNALVSSKGAKKGQIVRRNPLNNEAEWHRPGYYDVSGYGDINTQADEAIGDARNEMLADRGGVMFLPAASYSVSQSVIPDATNTAAKFVIEGESAYATNVETDQDIRLIVARDQMSVGKLKLSNTHANKIGRAISTNDGKQSRQSSFKDGIIEGFRFGIWQRYSIWNNFRNLTLQNNTCAIRLARAAYQEDNSNPETGNNWNSWQNGWFHNALVFDNVLCNGGEVGIWAASMCATYMSCTTQAQQSDGIANDVLPDGTKGTGIRLDAGYDGNRSGWNNAIISHYVENTDVGVHAINQKFLDINGLFMQGRGPGGGALHAVLADNSFVMARGICGQSYFDDAIVKAVNGSKVVLEGGLHGPMIGIDFEADAISEVLPRGQVDEDKQVYRLSKLAGESKSFTLPVKVPQKAVMKLYFNGIYDGYSLRSGECTVVNWSAATATTVTWVGAQTSNLNVSVSNEGIVTVQLSGTQSHEQHVIAQVIGGDQVSNTKFELTGV